VEEKLQAKRGGDLKKGRSEGVKWELQRIREEIHWSSAPKHKPPLAAR